MNTGRNRVVMALGMLATVAMLLGAFMVVWLMPRGPEIGNASTQNPGTGMATGAPLSNSGAAPISKSVAGQTSAQNTTSAIDQPHIAVNGTGIISAKADIVDLRIGTQIQKDSLDAAQTEASNKMNNVMAQLKAAGIAEKDISTAQYNVEPVMNYRDNQPPTVSGYRVTNILNVKVRDISKAGKLVDDMVKSGANTIYGLSFGFSDPTALIKQAREQAMNDAKSKADQLATLGGITLGTPIVIAEGSASVPVPMTEPMLSGDTASRSAGAAPPPINPGQQEVRVEVQVMYGIK